MELFTNTAASWMGVDMHADLDMLVVQESKDLYRFHIGIDTILFLEHGLKIRYMG